MFSFTRQGLALLTVLLVTGSLVYLQVRLIATHDYYSALSHVATIPFCGREPVRDSMQKSAAVVKATVFVVTEKNERAEVVLTIENVYAGTISEPTITVYARIADEKEEGRGSDLHFASGQPPYLLFLRKAADGEWQTSRCYGSRMLKGELTEEERGVLEETSP